MQKINENVFCLFPFCKVNKTTPSISRTCCMYYSLIYEEKLYAKKGNSCADDQIKYSSDREVYIISMSM